MSDSMKKNDFFAINEEDLKQVTGGAEIPLCRPSKEFCSQCSDPRCPDRVAEYIQ